MAVSRNSNLSNLHLWLLRYGVYGSFALRLLGDVYSRTHRLPRACAAYRAALALNPFLYTCYMALMDNYAGTCAALAP